MLCRYGQWSEFFRLQNLERFDIGRHLIPGSQMQLMKPKIMSSTCTRLTSFLDLCQNVLRKVTMWYITYYIYNSEAKWSCLYSFSHYSLAWYWRWHWEYSMQYSFLQEWLKCCQDWWIASGWSTPSHSFTILLKEWHLFLLRYDEAKLNILTQLLTWWLTWTRTFGEMNLKIGLWKVEH